MYCNLNRKFISRGVFVISTILGAIFTLYLGTVAAPKDATEPALASVQELMAHKQFEESLPILSEIIGKNPTVVEPYALRGVCYYRQEEFERALRDFQEYFKRAKEPAPILYHRLYGLALCQFQKFPEALKQFNITTKREPKVWDYWFDRAQLYSVTKQYDKALADANIMVSLRPDHFRYALRAKIYKAMGNYQKSIDDWTTAVKQCPERRDYYEERAKCYDKLGKAALAASDRKMRDAELND